MVVPHYYNLPKPIERTTPKVNSNVNYGLSVIMMCQCRFVNSNKRTTLVGDVENGGGYAGVYRRSLHLPLDFAVDLNCSKNKVIQNIFMQM